MASARSTITLEVSPKELWTLIGGFGSIPDWIPGVTQSQLAEGGRIRHLTLPDGRHFIEQLETYDNANHRYSYSILESPLSITDYLATISVRPSEDGKSSQVEWSGTFTPQNISEAEAEATCGAIFSGGLHVLAERYSPATQAK